MKPEPRLLRSRGGPLRSKKRRKNSSGIAPRTSRCVVLTLTTDGLVARDSSTHSAMSLGRGVAGLSCQKGVAIAGDVRGAPTLTCTLTERTPVANNAATTRRIPRASVRTERMAHLWTYELFQKCASEGAR